MSLKLMYITNDPAIASIAERAGVDRIFVDLECIGKAQRQAGLDTVQSRHTIADVARLRSVVTDSELLVRINPMHTATADYVSSEEEIEQVIANGADVIMLPYFKTAAEAAQFIELVGGRAKTVLLVETPEAVEALDAILDIPGVDEVHIGINDLSIGMGRRFLFELLADGTVENLCAAIQKRGIPCGFGGIASMGKGLVPAQYVIMEHYRLQSTQVILSRSFCDIAKITDKEQIEEIFLDGVRKIREYEEYCANHPELWKQNQAQTVALIQEVAAGRQL